MIHRVADHNDYTRRRGQLLSQSRYALPLDDLQSEEKSSDGGKGLDLGDELDSIDMEEGNDFSDSL
jgi:hypothetical protein